MVTETDVRGVLDALPAMVWTALPDGCIDFVNRRWSEYTGVGLAGHNRWEWQDFVSRDDLPGLVERWQLILVSGESGDMEGRIRRFDGQYRQFLIQASPMRDTAGRVVKWYGVGSDVHEFQQTKEALRRRQLDFQLIVASIPVPVAVTTPTGEVEDLNQPTLDYFGKTFEELKGWKTSDVVHPDDLEYTVAAQQSAHVNASTYNVESRHLGADGVYRWYNVRGFPLRDERGHILRWFHLLIDIDDQKRAEAALAASERNLNEIINAIPAQVWSARQDGSAEFFNQHYLDYVGLPVSQVQDWGWTTAVHADDLKRLVAVWQAKLDSGTCRETEVRLRRHDGQFRWFLFRASPLRDENGNVVKWFGTNTDIDDRKRAETELRRSEAFLAEGQNLARMGTFSWHVATGNIVCSEQFYRIFEFRSGTVLTLDLVVSRVYPEDLSLIADMIERAQRGDSDFEYQHRILMPNQSVKHLQLNARRAYDRPGQIEYIGAVLDVTQRRLAEEALGKARSELAHVARVTSLGTLAASIAHEINQPLSAIVTNAATCLRMLVIDPPNVEGARETARRTIRDGERAAEMISRLRALFSKRYPIIEAVDLNHAAREVIQLLQSDLERVRVILRTEFPEKLPLVGGDRVQLQQVIMNLMRNAADAMSSVHDRPRWLSIRTEADANAMVRLTVQDAGVGFQPAHADRLFDAFYTTKSDGMGIGLSVSRSIVESHGGRVWAVSNDGPGAAFAFSIPVYDSGV